MRTRTSLSPRRCWPALFSYLSVQASRRATRIEPPTILLSTSAIAGTKTLTPMDQSNKPSDIKMTREIRRAIVKDRALSTDAKNIKIITIDGAVTLRGPVKTDQERADIAAKAAQLAGDSNVHNELEVAGR